MAELEAGSGIFFRAYVTAQHDDVLRLAVPGVSNILQHEQSVKIVARMSKMVTMKLCTLLAAMTAMLASNCSKDGADSSNCSSPFCLL